jgi:hypothetical protein
LKIKALLILFGPTDGTEILRVAQVLRRSERFEPEVLFFGSYEGLRDRLDYSGLEGISVYDLDHKIIEQAPVDALHQSLQPASAIQKETADSPQGARVTSLREMAMRLPETIRSPLLRIRTLSYHLYYFLRIKLNQLLQKITSFNLMYHILNLRTQNKTAENLLKRHAPDILILPLEALGHVSANFARVSEGMGIPCAIVPYTVPINIGEVCERWCEGLYYKNYGLSNFTNRWIAKYYSNWVYEYKGRKLLRLTAAQILATEWVGMAPSKPWMAGGMKYARAIAVENSAMYDYYLKEGFSEDKLKITGALVDDILADGMQNVTEKRRLLCRELKLPEDKPILLSSMPADFVYREACDFRSFSDLAEFWIKALASMTSYNIVIRLHPSLSFNECQYLEKWGIKISRRDTASLMPLCKLFVTTVSATIRWAIACGIPVVNYDVYRFRYHDYDEAQGVLTIEESDEFLNIIRTIDLDPSFYEDLAKRQLTHAHRWGKLDGRTGHRMLALFENLYTSEKMKKTPSHLSHGVSC